MSKLFSTVPGSLRIGVLRGGQPPEYDISLVTGAHILKTLSETHSPIDIFISKEGKWYVSGVEKSPETILKSLDIVINSLHGNFGEDGKVQEILNNYGIKYVGSDRYPSAISINRHLTKDQLIPFGIKTPVHATVKKGENVLFKSKEIWDTLMHPFAVKPGKGGSAFGFTVAENFNDLVKAIEYLLDKNEVVLIEEFIPGISVSCLVTEDYMGQELYAFPPSQILKPEQTEAVQDMAKSIHKLLNLSHYSQSDFVVSPKRGIYFLEVDTSPKIAEKSLATKAVQTIGSTILDFLHHLILLVMNK